MCSRRVRASLGCGGGLSVTCSDKWEILKTERSTSPDVVLGQSPESVVTANLLWAVDGE